MSLRQCCFLSTDSLDGYTCDDDLAIGPLREIGWDVATVSWRDKAVNWNDFEIVVVRSTWDYQREPGAFLDVLQTIESSGALLENSLDIVKWNLDKRYLRDLGEKGVNIVPTIWDGAYDEVSFGKWIEDAGTDEIIIKPTISATAQHTYRMRHFDPNLAHVFANRPFLVQPFLQSILNEGEYSLFYFGGKYSHTILKVPGRTDFRVQEEHGGIISAAQPTVDLLGCGRAVLDTITPVPLYARVDLVGDAAGDLAVMELELIEPALYLRMDPDSPMRFAAAIDERMR
jgi:hypothetical protein